MAKYDVFISFKNIDTDAAMAENLYNRLTREGIKVFFSNRSILEQSEGDSTASLILPLKTHFRGNAV